MLLSYRIPLITGSILALTALVNIIAFQFLSERHFSEYISTYETEGSLLDPDQLRSFIELSQLDREAQREYTDVLGELSNLSTSIENISRNPELYMSSNTGMSREILSIPLPNSTGSIDFGKLFLPFNIRALGEDTAEGRFVTNILSELLLVNLIWLCIILIGYFLWIRSIFRPIQSIIDNLEQIIGKKSSTNIDYTKNNEFQPLIQTINNLHRSLSIQEKIRSDFLSDLSHEIRTPITALKCYLDGIEDGVLKLDPKMLSLLQNELTRLIDITGQVMDYENMLRDTYKSTHIEEFSLKELYTDLIDSYEPQLTESGQSIVQKYHRSTHIRMDRNMCIQIFHNMISNFIKYAGRESILTIDYLVTDREYIVSFSDTGHGIPDEELEYVKEKFYRVDKGRNQEDKSMGIGLSIVERIAHLHRGSLTVEKNHPQGVKFIVKIGR